MTTDFEIIEINNSEEENSELVSLSKDIEKKYPFTLIDKENYQTKIDQINSAIWIEGLDRSAILFNKKYAERFINQNNSRSTDYYSEVLQKNIKRLSKILNEFTGINDEPISVKLKTKEPDGQSVLIHIQRILFRSETLQKLYSLNRMEIVSETNMIQSQNTLTDFYLNLIHRFTTQYLIISREREIIFISDQLKVFLGATRVIDAGVRLSDVFSEEVVKIVNNFENSRSESSEINYDGLLSDKFNRYFKGRIFVCLLPGRQKRYLFCLINSPDQNEIVTILGKEKMVESLIHNNPEPIYIFDKENLTFLDVNKAASDLYGYSKDEFLQMDITDLYLPDDIQTLLDNSEDKQSASFFTGTFRQRKKDGSLILVELSKNSWTYEGRDSYLNIIRDVTGVKNLEKQVQLFKNVFDNTDDLLFVTDMDGIITYVNNSTVKTLGYSKEDLESSAFSSLLIEEERANINANIFHSYLKDTITIVAELKKSDDSHLEVELTASPVLDYKNEIESFSLIATVNKILQPISHEIVKEMVKEIRDEKSVNVPSIKINIDESTFLSSLFHQILTPINVIMGFVQELTEGIPNLSADQKEMADIINQNRLTLLNTMNSLVEYSNIIQKKYELTVGEIAVTELIDELQKNFNDITGSDSIEFAYGKISSSLKYESDQKKFISFISQLIKILVKLKKSKKIFFSVYQYDDNNFIVSVKDSYPIASDLLVNSFDILFSDQPRVDKKDLGLPKLSTQLSSALLQVLKGKFQIISDDPSKVDYGFIFPLKYSDAEVFEPLEAETKVQESEISSQKVPAIKIEEVKKSESENIYSIKENPIKVIDVPSITQNFETEALSPTEPEHIPTVKEIVTPLTTGDKPEEIIPSQTAINEPDSQGINIEEVQLPKEPITPQKINEQRPSSSLDLSTLSCLYIEDQVDSQIFFKVHMKELKSIQFAVGFEESLPLLEKNKFDFIVMDINLQGEYNGLDALRLIHKMSQYEKIPIIAVTAYVLPGDKEKFITTGFTDFIAKPIFHDKLVESLKKIFHF